MRHCCCCYHDQTISFILLVQFLLSPTGQQFFLVEFELQLILSWDQSFVCHILMSISKALCQKRKKDLIIASRCPNQLDILAFINRCRAEKNERNVLYDTFVFFLLNSVLSVVSVWRPHPNLLLLAFVHTHALT